MTKSLIGGVRGETGLMLPALLNEGLAENDCTKYVMALLQLAGEHVDRLDSPTPT